MAITVRTGFKTRTGKNKSEPDWADQSISRPLCYYLNGPSKLTERSGRSCVVSSYTNGLDMVKGFKQTEIGLIPEDWELKELGEIGSFSKGKGISKSEANSGEIPAIRYGELYTKHDNVIREFHSFINAKVANGSIKLKRGDILF